MLIQAMRQLVMGVLRRDEATSDDGQKKRGGWRVVARGVESVRVARTARRQCSGSVASAVIELRVAS